MNYISFMKKHLYPSLFILIFSFSLQAQNFKTVTPLTENFYQKSNYSGNDFLVLKIDSVTTSGTETIYHPMRSFRGNIDSNGCLVPNDTSWMGIQIVQQSNGDETYFTLNLDSIHIKCGATLNQNWHLYDFANGDYFEATVTALNVQSVLGNPDSCKVITLQKKDALGNNLSDIWNNKSIILSKNYGAVKMYGWRDFPSDTSTMNISYSIATGGEGNLTADKIFDFAVNDVYEYTNQWNAAPATSGIRYERYQVLNKYIAANSDTIIYEYDYKYYQKSYTYNPLDSSISMGEDTLLQTHIFSQNNLINSFAAQLVIDSSGLWGTTAGTIQRQFKLASYYNNKMSKMVYPHYSVFNYPCIENGLNWCVNPYYYYAEGIGMTEKSEGSACPYTYLSYFLKGTETYGTPVDWSILLSANENEFEHKISVYPNPAVNEVSIKSNVAGELSVYNSNGQKVFIYELQNETSVKISHLPPGIYFYSVTNDKGKRSGKFVVVQD